MRYDPSFGRRARFGWSGQSLMFAGLVMIWLLATGARAADFVSVKTGNWFDPSTWELEARYPVASDNGVVSSNDNVGLIFSNSLSLQINNLVLSNSTLSMSSSAGLGFLALAGAHSEWTNATLGGNPLQLGTLDLLGDNSFFAGTTVTNQGIIHQICQSPMAVRPRRMGPSSLPRGQRWICRPPYNGRARLLAAVPPK